MNDDTISRRAAIDAFMTATSDGDKAEWCRWVLKQLPSAQSEKRTEERMETHACDCISRQEVIDTVHKIIYGFFSEKDGVMTDTEKTLLSVNKLVCNGVRELPPAQPEEAIPVAWIEEQAKCLESKDNAFAKIEANNIRVMIKKWRMEKDERSDFKTGGD